MLQVKFKKLSQNAKQPFAATEKAAAYDITPVSIELKEIEGSYRLIYDFGLAFEFPDDYDMKLYLRSSASKKDLILCNHVGIGDADYRGSYKAIFAFNFQNKVAEYKGVAIPVVNFQVLRLNSDITIEGYYDENIGWIPLPINIYKINDAPIMQIQFQKKEFAQFTEVTDLSDTIRGEGGFGSTGTA